jgi:hypothetical protein
MAASQSRAMRHWAHLFVFLLAAAYAVAGLPWLVAHGLLHHSPERDAAAGQHEYGGAHCPEEAAMVETLVHGHPHPDGAPEHVHGMSPTISFRNDPPDLQAPRDAGPIRLASPEALERASTETGRSAFLAAVGPPSRPYSLCILLI